MMPSPTLKLAVNFQRLEPARGGAETYVADLCRRLVQAGHHVELLAESWVEEALPAEVRRLRVPVSGWTRPARIWSFAERSAALLSQIPHDCSIGFINTWKTDILIPQGGVHQASLEHNARRFPDGWRRRLYLAAKRAHPKYHLYQALERRQYDPTGGARVVVAVSRFVEGHLQRYHAVAPERIRVIPNAIDTDRLAVAAPAEVRARTRAGLGLKPDDLVALFVAHNFRLKGLPDLLHALALRARHVPAARPIQLLVCGGGRRAPMRRLAARLGLEPNVRLLGFLPDVRAVFHAADLFVLPTYYDPCSLVVFEALACGLPVITTACNGAAELITPGREGFVIPEPAAHAALAQALEALSDDRRRAACAAQARDLGRRQSLDRHLAALLSLCEQVAAAKRRHAGTGFPPQRKRGRDASHRPGRR